VLNELGQPVTMTFPMPMATAGDIVMFKASNHADKLHLKSYNTLLAGDAPRKAQCNMRSFGVGYAQDVKNDLAGSFEFVIARLVPGITRLVDALVVVGARCSAAAAAAAK
jgi:hypothetical protein